MVGKIVEKGGFGAESGRVTELRMVRVVSRWHKTGDRWIGRGE